MQVLTGLTAAGAALAGIFLATYTGTLIAVTAVPAWNTHRSVLPFHFGMAGLGSAAAVLEFAGFKFLSLHWIGLVAAAAETLVMLWLELRKHGPIDLFFSNAGIGYGGGAEVSNERWQRLLHNLSQHLKSQAVMSPDNR